MQDFITGAWALRVPIAFALMTLGVMLYLDIRAAIRAQWDTQDRARRDAMAATIAAHRARKAEQQRHLSDQ